MLTKKRIEIFFCFFAHFTGKPCKRYGCQLSLGIQPQRFLFCLTGAKKKGGNPFLGDEPWLYCGAAASRGRGFRTTVEWFLMAEMRDRATISQIFHMGNLWREVFHTVKTFSPGNIKDRSTATVGNFFVGGIIGNQGSLPIPRFPQEIVKSTFNFFNLKIYLQYPFSSRNQENFIIFGYSPAYFFGFLSLYPGSLGFFERIFPIRLYPLFCKTLL